MKNTFEKREKINFIYLCHDILQFDERKTDNQMKNSSYRDTIDIKLFTILYN